MVKELRILLVLFFNLVDYIKRFLKCRLLAVPFISHSYSRSTHSTQAGAYPQRNATLREATLANQVP